MDFTTIDPATRIFLFSAIFATTAIAATWMLLSSTITSTNRQYAAIAGGLATIPAAIAAPTAPEGSFTFLALLAFAGLALTVTTIILTAINEEQTVTQEIPAMMMPAPAAPAFAPATMAAPVVEQPVPSTRVATYESLATNVGLPGPESDAVHTMVRGASFKLVNRIAFFAEQTGDGTAHRLGDDNHLGRAAGSTIVINDDEASREHCRVKFENGRFVLYDLGGVNGTYLKRDGRSRKITTPTMLHDKDVITIGRVKLAYFEVDR